MTRFSKPQQHTTTSETHCILIQKNYSTRSSNQSLHRSEKLGQVLSLFGHPGDFDFAKSQMIEWIDFKSIDTVDTKEEMLYDDFRCE